MGLNQSGSHPTKIQGFDKDQTIKHHAGYNHEMLCKKSEIQRTVLQGEPSRAWLLCVPCHANSRHASKSVDAAGIV